ncbi:MAG TPA: TolC family protein [Bryobacteraceae bacterium]|nr:TolC family protein [Bryobacteraceae bacterium]
MKPAIAVASCWGRRLRLPTARSAAPLVALYLLLSHASAQPSGKQQFTFHGKVEAVDLSARRLTIANDPVPGWMGAMTMSYRVSNEDVFNRVKPGDRVTAKVYPGDLELYDVQVLPQPSVPAPASAALRLGDLEQMALANNPTMAQARANFQVAAGRARQAGLYPNPSVGYYGDEIRGGSFGGGEQGGFISQTIVLGGKLGAARQVARLAAGEAQTASEAQRLRILTNVRALFYQVLAAQRMVGVRQNLVRLAGDAAQTSRQLGNIGQAERPDILQAEVDQQQATVSLRVAERNLQACWRILAAAVGKPDLPQAALEGDLESIPQLNYEESLGAALRESPEVKLAAQQVERAQASLVEARKAPIPDLQVTGILMQSNEALPPTGRPTGLIGGAQAGIQLPLFNRNQGNIAAARSAIESAQQELARVQLAVRQNLAALFRDYDSARLTAEQYKTEMLPRAEQAYRLYQSNYQKMAGAWPQVLFSQRTLFDLEIGYIQALDNAWQSALLIQGFGLTGALEEPAAVSPLWK